MREQKVLVEAKLNLNEPPSEAAEAIMYPALSLSDLARYRHNDSIFTKLAITYPGAE
jgi:hypothetical protein